MIKRFLFTLLLILFFTNSALAAQDPRNSPNNKVGIGVLSPEVDIPEAASMVNNGGDWGWVLILIKKSERDVDRWQKVFFELNKYKLIPIVRIATDYDAQGYWQKPQDEDVHSWADFLAKLYWPTKNRYVQVYNEVNRAAEWGGNVDAGDYAKELNKTIDALKAKSGDFFVLNAPLDLALSDSDSSADAATYLAQMEAVVPGIFKKLDGWASHSYPNPDFSASPNKSGRTSIDGYKWELSQISQNLERSDLPVFITETGWDRSKLSEDQVANFYEVAFKNVWNDNRVVAVTPFIFNYPEGLFHDFSFKKEGDGSFDLYYLQYEKVKNLAKEKGSPERDDLASITEIYLPKYVIKESENEGQIILKNLGNYIWDKHNIKITTENSEVIITSFDMNRDEVYPGQNVAVEFKFTTSVEGEVDFSPKVLNEDRPVVSFEWQLVSETYPQRVMRIIKQLFFA